MGFLRYPLTDLNKCLVGPSNITYSDVDVAAGIVPGISNGRIVAFDPSIATMTAADIWDGCPVH